MSYIGSSMDSIRISVERIQEIGESIAIERIGDRGRRQARPVMQMAQVASKLSRIADKTKT